MICTLRGCDWREMKGLLTSEIVRECCEGAKLQRGVVWLQTVVNCS